MYSVNAGIPKTAIQIIVSRMAEIEKFGAELSKVLRSVVDTPISPELKPTNAKGDIDQKTEDVVGPYELHDFFLYNFLGYGYPPQKIFYMAKVAFKDKYDAKSIKRWLREFYRRFFAQQYKRNCLPDGPKVTAVSLSPRGYWRMPSDVSSNAWLAEVDALSEA